VPDFFQHVGDLLTPDVLPVLLQRPPGTCLFGLQNLLELWQLFPFHQPPPSLLLHATVLL
jgi:hypothetical protein